ARHDHHVCAGFGEGQHNLPAEATTATGDQGDFFLQPEAWELLDGHLRVPDSKSSTTVVDLLISLNTVARMVLFLLSRTIVTVPGKVLSGQAVVAMSTRWTHWRPR